MEQMKLRTLSVLFENEPDALLRIIGLISRRGIILEGLTLELTEEEASLSRMIVQARLTGDECRKLTERLLKIIQVLQVKQ